MRTTAERRGRPDRSRAGNFRAEGHPDAPRCCPTNPRRGYPDRTNAGTARRLDRRVQTRNRLREQFGRLTWIGLEDTDPTEIVLADAGKIVAVNTAGDGLEFSTSTTSDIPIPQAPPAPVAFTAAGSYSHTHSLGTKPAIAVLNSDGYEIEVCVYYFDLDTVIINFAGTITDGVLLVG